MGRHREDPSAPVEQAAVVQVDALAALEAIIDSLPELWGDDVREGTVVVQLRADDIETAIAVIHKAKQQPLQIYEAGWDGVLEPEAFSGDRFIKLST